jgi:phage baseplate assembly protein W
MPVFSDINLRVYELNNSPLVYDLDVIKQQVLTVLSTQRGERVFRPEFGCDLYRHLMKPVDGITASDIYDEIVESLSRWMTSIQLIEVRVTPDYIEQQYYVSIQYRVPSLESADGITFNLGRPL